MARDDLRSGGRQRQRAPVLPLDADPEPADGERPSGHVAEVARRNDDGLWQTVRGVERSFLVGTSGSNNGAAGDWPSEESLNELRQLATTAGATVIGQIAQRLRSPHPRTFIGAGKVAELALQRADDNINLFIFDDELSPSQARNLETELGAKVIDRTGLVLDIFGQRARTHEGRLQVQLAQYDYLLPRLTGQWTHLSRQEGGVGARGGPGETQLEVDRRRVRSRISELKRDLDRVRQTRGLHRERRAAQSVALVSLVGYTNAGKSTLLNALTGAGVLAEDKLFATLDPTTRRVRLPSGREVVFSDTVGFIQKLPASVVAAFRATLEELSGADLLVHVVDASHPDAAAQADEVESVIASLDLVEKPLITALNKLDVVTEAWPPVLSDALESLQASRESPVLIAAAKDRGLGDLLLAVERALAEDLEALVADVPYTEGTLVNLWRTRGVIEGEEYQAESVRVTGRLPRKLLHRFERFRVRVPNTRAVRRGTGSRSR